MGWLPRTGQTHVLRKDDVVPTVPPDVRHWRAYLRALAEPGDVSIHTYSLFYVYISAIYV